MRNIVAIWPEKKKKKGSCQKLSSGVLLHRVGCIASKSVEGDKPRVVADLGGPHWGEEDNSINAGIALWDERRLAQLKLTSPILFGEIVGILASAGVPMKIGKSDWSRYYRQVAKPPSEYWHQVI